MLVKIKILFCKMKFKEKYGLENRSFHWKRQFRGMPSLILPQNCL